MLVLNHSSAVLEKLKVETSTSDESSSLDGVAGGSRISDEVTSDAVVVFSDIDSKLVLVASSGLCSVLTINGSPVEMLLVLVISPDMAGFSDVVAWEDVGSPMLLIVGPSELETTSLLVLSAGDVSSRALLLVVSSGDVASGFMLPVLLVFSPNEDVMPG